MGPLASAHALHCPKGYVLCPRITPIRSRHLRPSLMPIETFSQQNAESNSPSSHPRLYSHPTPRTSDIPIPLTWTCTYLSVAICLLLSYPSDPSQVPSSIVLFTSVTQRLQYYVCNLVHNPNLLFTTPTFCSLPYSRRQLRSHVYNL
jgi:hypothetical protein